jgi:transcriptional regulator with XRE-family HTH domain
MARNARAPSPEGRALADEIRRLREQGVSVREIARRTGLSKSHVHNIAIGKRGISAERATAAAERLSFEQQAWIITGGQLRAVDPVSRRDRQKIGRHWRAVQDARRSGDFRQLRRRFRRTVIKTSEGEFHLETDPAVLRDLDDAGLLALDEVFHYEPIATAA